MALSSRLKDAGVIARFGQIAGGRLWVHENEGMVSGAVHLSRWGVLLPSFNTETLNGRDEEFLRKLLISRRDILFSIIGTDEPVRYLETLLGESPSDYEKYRILTSSSINIPVATNTQNITLRKASIDDKERLWPLERAYQIEEVIRGGSSLNEHAGRKFLLSTLRRQLVYFASRNGKPVAKANTNARGILYDQIGGVYVVPELRNRGIAEALLRQLLGAIHSEGRRACLFVKESNAPALRLYEKLKFTDRGPFRISYWGQ